MRPMIGISARRHEGSFMVGERYVEMVHEAGGVPVLLPYQAGEDIVKQLDGLVLSGGGDVHPDFAGYDSPSLSGLERERDAFELSLVHFCAKVPMPLLGICRGTQVINLGLGGTLLADLKEAGISEQHSLQEDVRHPVHLAENTQLHRLLQNKTLPVNSVHHQAVDRLGRDLIVGAESDAGVVEAIEHTKYPMLGIQWHPERMAQISLFAWLCDIAIYYHSCKSCPKGVI